MKLDARRVEAFLADPGACRLVLLHGEDAGLVHERACRLVRVVAGSLDDAFRTAELDREAHGRLAEEMTALSLTGGRRAVLVREATDGLSGVLAAALERPGEALVVLESGVLSARGKLRSLIERRSDCVAIACYPEDQQGLERTIRSSLGEQSAGVDDEAVTWLATQLGVDRGATRQELGKLALYAGKGRIDLAAAMACVGDLGGLQLDDALFAATAGRIEAADRALELAAAEGLAPVSMLRATLQHLQRLERVQAMVDQGAAPGDAARAARPQVFFRHMPAFMAALRLWNSRALREACEFVAERERACKRTGAPAEVLCRDTISSLGRQVSRKA